MGNSSEKNTQPESDDTDDSFEFWEHVPQSFSGRVTSLDTDAVQLSSKTLMNSLTPKDVISLELTEFNEDEKVSLIFLLSDDVIDCCKTNNINLHQWALRNEYEERTIWKEKFVEAVTIIKNFRALRKLRFDKDILIDKYSPFLHCTSKYVNRFRKTLYLICEKLTAENESEFVVNLKLIFSKNGILLPPFNQTEQLFARLLNISLIEEKNVKTIHKIFKQMGLENICDMLENYQQLGKEPERIFSTINFSTEENNKQNGSLNEVDNTATTQKKIVNLTTKNNRSYKMNGEKICLIINQESFYTETKPEFKNLLPKNYSEQLHQRDGTMCDALRLKESFENRNFLVERVDNLNHLKIIEKLKETIQKVNEQTCSCLFVCILSHGDEGVIYGCNSCSVPVSQIIQIMCDPKLNHIPKILILQSCQGTALQSILNHENNNLETDGPSNDSKSTIKTSHFLLFYSSVPGFASVRDKLTGSWFIQSLCSSMDEFGDDEHFLDICIETNKKVRQKLWKKDGKEYYMVPIVDTTFTKKLYLNGFDNNIFQL